MNEIKAKVLFDYQSRGENELDIKMGEVVELLDTTNKEWWKGRVVHSKKMGFFPFNYVEPLNLNSWKKMKAIFDFEKTASHELTIKKGQIVHVKELKNKEEWWEGESHGFFGAFPSAFVIPAIDEKVSKTKKDSKYKVVIPKVVEKPKEEQEEKEMNEQPLDSSQDHRKNEEDSKTMMTMEEELKLLRELKETISKSLGENDISTLIRVFKKRTDELVKLRESNEKLKTKLEEKELTLRKLKEENSQLENDIVALKGEGGSIHRQRSMSETGLDELVRGSPKSRPKSVKEPDTKMKSSKSFWYSLRHNKN